MEVFTRYPLDTTLSYTITSETKNEPTPSTEYSQGLAVIYLHQIGRNNAEISIYVFGLNKNENRLQVTV